jgi:hypothetical protein
MKMKNVSNIYVIVMIISVLLALVSYFETAYFHYVPNYAFSSFFFINDTIGVEPNGKIKSFPIGGYRLFLAYILFHSILITANGIAAISASPLYPVITSKIKRLFFPLLLVLLSCYLISYHLLAVLIAWFFCSSFVLCNWPKADNVIQSWTFYLILVVNLLYLFLLLVGPVVPLGMMP